MTSCSIPNMSIDFPISLLLQLDVVGVVNVWEYADWAFPNEVANGLWESCPVLHFSWHWSITIDAKE